MSTKVLIIDDEELFANALAQELNEEQGFSAKCIGGKPEIAGLEKETFDLILLDLRLKEHSGLGLLPDVVALWPKARVYMMTGFGTIATAVTAIKAGATDYLTKPITVEKIKGLLGDSQKEEIVADTPMSLDRVEREYIEHVLVQEEGNITKAAKKLGLHRQSLQRKLKKWVPSK